MVWGKKTTVDAEFIAKAAASASVVIMPARTFGPEECVNLCAALCSSHTLTELGASGHAVGERGAHALGELLARADCSLRKLSLGDANFGDAGVLALLDGLAGSPAASLEELDLEFKGLSAACAAPLGQLARALPSLRRLTLARNALGDAAAAALGGGVAASAAPLAHLDVSACDLGEAALASLGAAARGGALGALRTLRASRNASIGGGGERAAAALRFLLEALPSLASLWLEECGLTAAFARALPATGLQLRSADGGGGGGGGGGVALEIGATALEELQIGRNAELGDGGGIAIADGVRGGALRTLGAAGCAFGDGAAAALAASSAHLVVLDLGSSKVGATGAAALLASPSLRSLRLFDNPAVGAGAAAALVPALCHGARALESLDLGACALDAPAIVALCAALRDGATAPALQTLELFGNEAAKGLKAELDAVRAARPALDVAWREAEREGDVKS